MTLEEAKQQVAEEDGYTSFDNIGHHLVLEYFKRAAELYKSVSVTLTYSNDLYVRKRCFVCNSLDVKHLETYNECEKCKSIM